MQKKNFSLSIINIIIYIIVAVIIGIILYTIIPKKSSTSKRILKENDIIINVGEKYKLNIESDKNLTFSSNNIKIAAILNDGTIYGVKAGKAFITVTTNDGQSEQCTVTVNNIEIDTISLDEESVNIKVGSSIILKTSITPTNATNKNIIWSSSNTNILEVIDGYVKAKKAGTAVVFATTSNGKQAKCTITVGDISNNSNNNNNKPITNIKLNYNGTTMAKTELIQLETIITPSDATDKKITWSTSNENIVMVSKKGQIYAKSVGKATITAKSNNGIKVSVIVTVKNKTYNKTAIFIGDSITMGNESSWPKYIGNHYELKESVNAGISGGVFSSFRGQYWLVDVVKNNSNKQYDYVILHGGINDISLAECCGEAKGDYNDNDFSGNYNTSTFIGGLETYIYTAKKQWPKAKFGYIINYKTPAAKSIRAIAGEYYSIIKKVCKKWDIKYLDLYSGKTSNGTKYSDLLQVTTNKYIGDGTHLNKAGYELISPHIYEWMNKL